MDITFESDERALWQDTLDLLSMEGTNASIVAMLSSCEPVSMEEGVMHVKTSMRLVQKNVEKNLAAIEDYLSRAAFQPMKLVIELVQSEDEVVATHSQMSQEAFASLSPTVRDDPSFIWEQNESPEQKELRLSQSRKNNPLVERVTEHDSRLTFDRFVQGDENIFAYHAALQVAEGENKTYNPLFIYGKSGLGKTHLLRAIQNYIQENDPERVCVYRDASMFKSDYVQAMQDQTRAAADMLTRNYQAIDVLIIDDIQKLAGADHTIDFFFDMFNYLTSSGKQIVLAADRSPAQLGMGKDHFDERITSRIDSGFTISIQAPSYELKVRLINTFYERLKADAVENHVPSMEGIISEELRAFMAENAGANIRVIESFCQSCLITASTRAQEGGELTEEDVLKAVREKWPSGKRHISVSEVQKAVEKFFGISHADLVGNKRNKELMEPRHVAVWLTRELTDITLADIGKSFGGRTHATVKHSISWVEDQRKNDKNFYDHLAAIQEELVDNI